MNVTAALGDEVAVDFEEQGDSLEGRFGHQIGKAITEALVGRKVEYDEQLEVNCSW